MPRRLPIGLPTVPGCAPTPYGAPGECRGRALDTPRARTALRERLPGTPQLTGAPELGKELGLRAYRTHTVWNGGIECRLLRIKVEADSAREAGTLGKGIAHLKDNPGAQMFANRLAKNLKHLRSWTQREQITCYRMYDADMPEYAFAIDAYRTLEPDAQWLYVQEYAAPAEIELDAVRKRRGEVLASLPQTTGYLGAHSGAHATSHPSAASSTRSSTNSRVLPGYEAAQVPRT
jgi:23S rRNA (guanine2445-N2)-methyltransferase / 23S rRNA (guanine2069-N7)-methyltransferase